jgi:hypothetical protein
MTIHRTGSKVIGHIINMPGARRQKTLICPSLGNELRGEEVKAHTLQSDRKLEVKDGEISLPASELVEGIVIEGL